MIQSLSVNLIKPLRNLYDCVLGQILAKFKVFPVLHNTFRLFKVFYPCIDLKIM